MLRFKTAKDEIDTNGFAIREGILSSDENARLLRAIERIGAD